MQIMGIHPQLVSLLTGIPLEAVEQPVTVEALPGQWVAYARKAHSRIVYLTPGHRETLTCRLCQRPATYDIGKVLVSAHLAARAGNKRSDMALHDWIQCTGYFRCRYCNGAGSWEFSDNFNYRLTIEFLSVMGGRTSSWVARATADLFDGYIYTFATDAEEHFFRLMASQGETAYLWNRLGNLYFKARRADLAMAALERSVYLDPTLLESDFTIGMILIQSGKTEAGAWYLRQPLAKAAHYDRLNANDLRDLLAHALLELALAYAKSGGAIAMLPGQDEWADGQTPIIGDPENDAWENTLRLSGRLNDPTMFYPLAELYLSPTQLQSLSNPSHLVSPQRHTPSVKKLSKRRQ